MTRFIRSLHLLAVSALLLVIVSTSSGQEKSSSVEGAERLRGAWRVISARDEGRDKPALIGYLYLFDSAKLHIITPQGRRTVYRYEPGPSSEPQQVTLLTDDDLFSQVAIYKLQDDTLSFCTCYKPGVVPTQFVTKLGDGCTSLVLKRDLDH